MKANSFLTIISILLAMLIGYLVYYMADGKYNSELYGVGTTICLITTLVPIMGLQYELGRLGTNIRVLSALFFNIFLISNFCFAIFGINAPYYIITNGIMLFSFLVFFYKLQNIKSI